jgi:hypothetical protein
MDEVERLRDQAKRCRRLAGEFSDKQTGQTLVRLAADYDRQADELEKLLQRRADGGDPPMT